MTTRGACGVLSAGGTLYDMLQPPLEAFSDKTMSRYSLVVATAKRARQIVNGAKVLIDTKSNKPVTVAMEEILAGKVSFEELGPGTK